MIEKLLIIILIPMAMFAVLVTLGLIASIVIVFIETIKDNRKKAKQEREEN